MAAASRVKVAAPAPGPARTESRKASRPKLRIGPAQDAFEQEADRVAQAVVEWGKTGLVRAGPLSGDVALQRKCSCGGAGKCKDCEDEKLQRKRAGGAAPACAPSVVHDVLSAPGRPLDRGSRGLMESALPPQVTALASRMRVQRKCSCGGHTSAPGGECEECKSKKRLQAKLVVGGSNDPPEREADRVADQVVAGRTNPGVETGATGVQRVTWAAPDSAGIAPASVDRVLAGSGRPLEPTLLQEMEGRFGQDFSRVRVHSGRAAEQSVQDVKAHAYTAGNNIVFGAGSYAPGTWEGLRLIAHELTHVVQQSVMQPVLRRQNSGTASGPASTGHSGTPPRRPTKNEQEMIDVARGEAAIRAQLAMMRVAGIVPSDPGGADAGAQMRAQARRLAQAMFEWATPNMEQVSQVVGTIVSRLMSPDVWVAGVGDQDCGSRAAYVRGFAPPIILCSNFFSGSPEGRTRTMIHEAAHLSGIGSGTLGESYCVVFDCKQPCGGFESADSWAQFIHCLSGGTPDVPEEITVTSPEAATARAAGAQQRADADRADRQRRLANVADRVFVAMKGLGTDEEAVYRALQELDRDQDQISELLTIYATRHKSSLLEDIHDDFSGTELEFALQLLNLGHSDTPQTVEDALFVTPRVAAQRIRDAVQGPGTDEEGIFAALMPFRRNTLTLQRAYQELFTEDLRDRIEEEMSGSELEYALDLMETPYQRYMQEASTWLRRFPEVGFGLPWRNNDWYDARFWRPIYDNKKKEWMLELYAGAPHEAIDALFHEQGRWHVDCTVFVEVVQLYALRQSLGARRFDQRVGTKLVLRSHRSSGVKSRVLYKRSAASAAFSVDGAPAEAGEPDVVLAEAPIGSRVRWTSQLLFDKANNLSGSEVWTIDQQSWPNFQHENTIKLGPDRYGAQGVGGGGRVSRERIEETLVDITSQQFPKESKAEIRAGIYISEIEIFEHPESSEQIEPQAQDGEKGSRP